MNFLRKFAFNARRRAVAEIVAYGVCCGVLITVLELSEYRFLLVKRSEGVYVALVAVVFAAIGIWFGLRFAFEQRKSGGKEVEVAAATAFVRDNRRVAEFMVTPRELEILGLIAEGLSTREMAQRLFVSENTVKTHSRRLFDKLGAKRRTQAVQIGKTVGLIP